MAEKNKSFRWQSNKVCSVRLRDGRNALMQTLDHTGYFAIFKHCSSSDNWSAIELDMSDIWTVAVTTKAFRSRSDITFQENIQPLLGIEIPEWKIYSQGLFEKRTFWADTENERSILCDDSEEDIGLYSAGRRDDGELFEDFTPISRSDYNKYTSYPMSGVRDYPEFNEVLYLSHSREQFLDPSMEIAFCRNLSLDCVPYIDIISGEMEISTFGY